MADIQEEIESHLAKIYESLSAIHHMITSDPEAVKALADGQPKDEDLVIQYPVLIKPIKELPFSVRLINNLCQSGHVNLMDLKKKSGYEILQIKNFGRKSYWGLKNFLKFQNILHFFPQL